MNKKDHKSKMVRVSEDFEKCILDIQKYLEYESGKKISITMVTEIVSKSQMVIFISPQPFKTKNKVRKKPVVHHFGVLK